MFRRLPDLAAREQVTIRFDGAPLVARRGDTVTAALLAGTGDASRLSPVGGTRRAPYCLMGVCFECLVTIDGVGNRLGCLVPVREGMVVERQLGARELGR